MAKVRSSPSEWPDYREPAHNSCVNFLLVSFRKTVRKGVKRIETESIKSPKKSSRLRTAGAAAGAAWCFDWIAPAAAAPAGCISEPGSSLETNTSPTGPTRQTETGLKTAQRCAKGTTHFSDVHRCSPATVCEMMFELAHPEIQIVLYLRLEISSIHNMLICSFWLQTETCTAKVIHW